VRRRSTSRSTGTSGPNGWRVVMARSRRRRARTDRAVQRRQLLPSNDAGRVVKRSSSCARRRDMIRAQVPVQRFAAGEARSGLSGAHGRPSAVRSGKGTLRHSPVWHVSSVQASPSAQAAQDGVVVVVTEVEVLDVGGGADDVVVVVDGGTEVEDEEEE